MTAFEYLNRARVLNRQIKLDHQELAILRETSISAQFGSCSGASEGTSEGGTPRSKVESAAIRIVSFENRIAEKMRELEKIKREITETISKLSDPVERIILTWRYVLLKPWSDVIDKTGYSRRQVFRVHKEAMRRVID